MTEYYHVLFVFRSERTESRNRKGKNNADFLLHFYPEMHLVTKSLIVFDTFCTCMSYLT